MPDVDEVARRLDAGERVTAIAADLGVTPRTIRNWLHAAGLPLASIRSLQRRLTLLADPLWLRQQHVDEGLSAWAIGQELEVPTAEARATLGKFGIARPPARPEPTAEALQAAFANAAGVDRSTVRSALTRHSIEKSARAPVSAAGRTRRREWLRAHYIDARMSIHAIADELGVAHNTVARVLRRHEVPQRRHTRETSAW